MTPLRVDLVNDTTTVEVHYAAASRPDDPAGRADRRRDRDPMSASIAALPTVTLDELNAEAELLTRVDRKYVIPADDLDAVVTGVADLRALAIGGHRSSRYESTYLDTVDLDSWASSAHPRRRRWKVRTRVYADTGTCWLEVKTRGARGVTVKERLAHPVAERHEVAAGADAWVVERLAAAGVHDIDPRDLVPTLHTSYRRTTLLLAAGAGRATIDRDLTWTSGHGTAGVGPVLVVETKSGTAAPGPLDRRLWALGHRPVRISKVRHRAGAAPRPDLAAQPLAPGDLRRHRRRGLAQVVADGPGTPSSRGRRSSSSCRRRGHRRRGRRRAGCRGRTG